MANILAAWKRPTEQNTTLKRSLGHTTSETQTLDVRRADSKLELEVVEKSTLQVSRETAQLHTELEEQVSEQATGKWSQANLA